MRCARFEPTEPPRRIKTRIYDISVPLDRDTPTHPDEPSIEVEVATRITDGANSNVSTLRMGTHSGTHVDPPAHFFDGTMTVDRLDLNMLCGPAYVTEILGVDEIGRDHLEAARIPPGVRRLLIKTSNSTKELLKQPEYQSHYSALMPGGARWIVDRGVKVVGIDYLSIEPMDSKRFDTHRVILGNRLAIAEGLDLANIIPGHYNLFCLPLKIARGDGAPARVILVEDL